MKSWKKRLDFFVQERRPDSPSEAIVVSKKESSFKPKETLRKSDEDAGAKTGDVNVDETDDKINLQKKADSYPGKNTDMKNEHMKVNDTEKYKEKHAVSSSIGEQQEKRPVSMHAIKCKCGNIVSSRVESCPDCGKNVEDLLNELRQDFYRINFTKQPKKK